MSLSFCPCCVSQPLIYVAVTVFFIVQLLSLIRESIKPKNKFIRLMIDALYWTINIAIVAFVVFLGVVATSPELKQKIFSQLCIKLAKNTELDEVRCNLLKNIEGNVLEIGPGPGTNFRCWKDNTRITNWVGVEPNEYFKAEIASVTQQQNISFPVKTVWLNGENIDVKRESFDVVVGTHLLCSVDDVDKVLNQIYRVLKPGGTYYFLEHVVEQEKNSIYYMQQLLQPLFSILGNGCQFKPTWQYLSGDYLPVLNNFDFQIEHFKAPVGLTLIAPHIKGKAVKKANYHHKFSKIPPEGKKK